MKALLLVTLVTGAIFADTATNNRQLLHEYLRSANECTARNEIDTAIQFYMRAIDVDPTNFNLVFEVANFLSSHGHREQALVYYDRAAQLNPRAEQVYFNKGVVHNHLNQHEQAATCFLQAIEVNSANERAHVHAIQSFRSCKKIDQGIEVAKRSVKLIANSAELHYRYGLLLKDKELHSKALKQFAKAVQIAPHNKQYLLELGNTLYRLDAHQEALFIFEHLLELNPLDSHVLYNFGVTLNALGFIEHAIQVYDRVVKLQPSFAQAHFSRALAHLTLGNFEQGLPGYEWRWRLGSLRKKHTDISTWTGSEQLLGKMLLIHAEQGLGDSVQFIRFAEMVKNEGAQIIVEIQPALADMFKHCPYIDAVYTYGQKLPHVDYQIPLMSLPFACNTTLATIPQNIPYIHPDPALVAYWKDKLKDDTTLKIGICWHGNPNYTTADLRHAVANKSLHPALFAPLARLQGVTLYNLQKCMGPEQLKELPPDMVIKEFDEPIDTEHGRFMDTVALMAEVLDLIITVDTSTCHVAGALGVPVWTLLPYNADWRWMQHRSDTPWYHSMRLFKQPMEHDWTSVIQECCLALQPILNGEKTIAEVTQEKGFKPEAKPALTLRTSSYLPQRSSELTHEHTQAYQVQIHPCIINGNIDLESLTHTQQNSAVSDEGSLKDVAHELITINKELTHLHQKLASLAELSPFDPDTIELFRACVSLYDRKCTYKKVISQACHA